MLDPSASVTRGTKKSGLPFAPQLMNRSVRIVFCRVLIPPNKKTLEPTETLATEANRQA